jgi:polar amino acid transport system substrate-binding protein
MNQFKIVIWLIFVVLPISSYGIEFSPQERAFIAQHKTIRVHNETDWAPFNFYENHHARGISIDVMDLIASRTGLDVEYVSGPSWQEFMLMMDHDELDVMLNIIDLPERRRNLKFTSAYIQSLGGIFTRGSTADQIKDFDDLKGKTVAIPAGFDVEITLPKYHPDVKLLIVRDVLECIQALISGKADAFMEEVGVVEFIMTQRVIPNITLAFPVIEKEFSRALSIATRKTDPVLHSIIQKGLNSISSEELNQIRRKWLLEVHDIYEQRTVNLNVAEKEYLYTKDTINICVDPAWPPLDFINKQGQHSGLSADLIALIAKRLDVRLQLVSTQTWVQSLQYMKEGRCEVIPLMNATDESSTYLDFSKPYFDFASVIVMRKGASFVGDYSELHGKKVAMQAYYFLTEYIRKHHPEIDVVEVENTIEALKLISEHQVYATIDSLPTVVNTIEAFALENVKIVGTVPQKNSLKIGVRKGNPLLMSVLNKGIDSLTEKEKVGLYKRWLNIELEDQFFNRGIAVKIAFIFIAIIVLLLWRYLTLGSYTKKLQVLNEQLHKASTVDHLTQVYNRCCIEKHIEHEVHQAELTHHPLSLVIFDMDHFKSINDSYGHMVGDRVLEKMASLVRESIRQNDLVGRWGGEEFVILLPNTTSSGATTLMDKLRYYIESADFGLERPVTASFGVGQFIPGETVNKFLSRVDDGLYKAKRMGRNCLYTDSVSSHV